MPRGIYVHKLSNVNLAKRLADCANCGNRVDIRIKQGKPRCAAAVRATATTETARKTRREYDRKRYAKNPISNKRGAHGLTVIEARAFRAGKCCEICGDAEPSHLVVDHDHATGKIRGVLCSKHNVALGTFGDSEEGILRVLAYLRKGTETTL
jgi:hypothetical protein